MSRESQMLRIEHPTVKRAYGNINEIQMQVVGKSNIILYSLQTTLPVYWIKIFSQSMKNTALSHNTVETIGQILKLVSVCIIAEKKLTYLFSSQIKLQQIIFHTKTWKKNF